MKKLTFLIYCLMSILNVSCDSIETLIKNDLNSRFTKFDLIEIKRDSSTVYDAKNTLRAIAMRIVDLNGEIIKTLYKIENETDKKIKYNDFQYIKSQYDDLVKSMVEFENSQYDRSEICYYVKYLVYKDELKIPHEDIYFIVENTNELIHRPYNWKDFLIEENYDDLIKEATKYSSDLYRLESKF